MTGKMRVCAPSIKAIIVVIWEIIDPFFFLSIISKVFEKVVFQQLYHYLKVNSIRSKFQSCFRPLHSTVSALIQMWEGWSDNMDKGKLTGVVFS